MTRIVLVFAGIAVLLGVLVVGGRSLLGGAGSVGARDAGVLDEAVIDQARQRGAAPELIYDVTVKGYTLARQSVGIVGEDGFGASYVAGNGWQVWLAVDRGVMTDAKCPDVPVTDAQPWDAPVRCERDEVGWYRVGGGRHEYVAVRGDHHITLAGVLEEVDRATLKAAVAGARPARVPDRPPSPLPSPVERGDLPPGWDGAPIQNTGPGG
ncbi:hypothetical protein AB0K60_08850 [Thermopolyspora sp. NPDC052614]|uniref:hypothetical protein n=1 Tax=Thermopolyspora sp. NPDC052614 TaxID=3155682 RepID=UPI0034193F57